MEETSTEGQAVEIHCFPQLGNGGMVRWECDKYEAGAESGPRGLWKKDKT